MNESPAVEQQPDEDSGFDPRSIERPDPALFRYYVLVSLLGGPISPLILLPMWFRYISLRYQFDESGVSMRWGILFRREVYLTYRRIQDIHLTRNILQRWMGLAKISLQTASGSSQAEMSIEGILEAEELRDYLYSQMRGAKNEPDLTQSGATATDGSAVQPLVGTGTSAANSQAARATQALEDIRDAMRQLVARQDAAGDNQ